jgi:hypothetical protein
MEAEAGEVAVRSDRPPQVDPRPHADLDNRHASRRQRRQPIEIRGQTDLMHGDDGSGPGRRPAARILRVDVPGVALDLGEDGRRPGVQHGIRRRDERVRRTDHFIACSDSACHKREMQRRRA